MRIESKNQQIEIFDVIGIGVGSSVLYKAVFEREIYRGLLPVDRPDLEARFG